MLHVWAYPEFEVMTGFPWLVKIMAAIPWSLKNVSFSMIKALSWKTFRSSIYHWILVTIMNFLGSSAEILAASPWPCKSCYSCEIMVMTSIIGYTINMSISTKCWDIQLIFGAIQSKGETFEAVVFFFSTVFIFTHTFFILKVRVQSYFHICSRNIGQVLTTWSGATENQIQTHIIIPTTLASWNFDAPVSAKKSPKIMTFWYLIPCRISNRRPCSVLSDRFPDVYLTTRACFLLLFWFPLCSFPCQVKMISQMIRDSRFWKLCYLRPSVEKWLKDSQCITFCVRRWSQNHFCLYFLEFFKLNTRTKVLANTYFYVQVTFRAIESLCQEMDQILRLVEWLAEETRISILKIATPVQSFEISWDSTWCFWNSKVKRWH